MHANWVTYARWHDEEQECKKFVLCWRKQLFLEMKVQREGVRPLENLLSELDEGHLVNRSNAVIQEIFVGDILRHAWALDQEAILNAQKEALDEVRRHVASMNPADLHFSRLFCLLTPPLFLLKAFTFPLQPCSLCPRC